MTTNKRFKLIMGSDEIGVEDTLEETIFVIDNANVHTQSLINSLVFKLNLLSKENEELKMSINSLNDLYEQCNTQRLTLNNELIQLKEIIHEQYMNEKTTMGKNTLMNLCNILEIPL